MSGTGWFVAGRSGLYGWGSAMGMIIRTFSKDDIPFALDQTEREGWDATAELFELCLAHDPDGCFIGEVDGQAIGMVTTTCFDRSAWIGNLIVPPEWRSRGIGRRLMTHALENLLSRGIRTIRLEADPAGIALYRNLGFVDEFESPRFRIEPPREPVTGSAVRLSAGDLPAVADFDTKYYGDDRGRLLSTLFSQALTGYCLPDGGAIRGYALVVPSRAGVRLGPWVAVDAESAEALLRSVLADFRDTPILLGAPSLNRNASALLESHGFSRTPSCPRMVYGDRVACGRPDKIYAIANGAMG